MSKKSLEQKNENRREREERGKRERRRSLPVILGGWGVRRVFTASVIWSFFFVTLLFSFGDPVHYPGLLQFLGY